MPDHDPLCCCSRHLPRFGDSCETCDLIARVRADERATTYARRLDRAAIIRADERERLRAQVESLLGVSPSSYWDDAVDTVLALLGGESDG